MARNFAGASNQSLTVDLTPSGIAIPFTMACWFMSTDTTTDQALMGLTDKDASNINYGLLAAGAQTGDPVRFVAQNTTARYATTSTGYTSGAWYHACGICAASNDRSAYINAGSVGTSSTNVALGTIDRTCIGRLVNTSSAASFTGAVAEAAIWSIALSLDEVTMLARGLRPLLVRPDKLIFYLPMVSSADIDLRGGLVLTPNAGPTLLDHPPITRKRRYFFIRKTIGPQTHEGSATLLANALLSSFSETTHNGIATLSGYSNTSAQAQNNAQGQATALSYALLSAQAQNEKQGDLSASGAALLSATAQVSIQADAKLYASATVSATATSGEASAPPVTYFPDRSFPKYAHPTYYWPNASASVTHTGEATLQGTGLLSVSAEVSKNSFSNLQGYGSLSTTAQNNAQGQATLLGAALLSAQAEINCLGETAIRGVAFVQAEGTVTTSIIQEGAATLLSVGQVSATATVEKQSEAILQGAAYVQATPRGYWFDPQDIIINAGSITSGFVSSMWSDDGSRLVLAETVGTPGFSYDFYFYDVTSEASHVNFNGYYQGNPAHNIKIQQYNFTTTGWTDLTADTNDFPNDTADYTLQFTIYNNSDYRSSGQIRLRIVHTSPGNPVHTLNIDHFELSSTLLGSATLTGAGLVSPVAETEKRGQSSALAAAILGAYAQNNAQGFATLFGSGAINAQSVTEHYAQAALIASGSLSATGTTSGSTSYLNAVLGTSPLALWKLDDTSGTTASDSSGSYNATYVGTGYSLANRLGPDGGYYVNFPGTGGYISASSVATVFSGSEGTFAGWVKIDTFANGDHLFLSQADASNYTRIEVRSTGLKFYYMAGGTNLNNESQVTPADWVHVALTWSQSASLVRGYINGEKVWERTGLGVWTGSPAAVRLATQATTDLLDGAMAYWGVWNSALTKATIKDTLFDGVTNPAADAPGANIWNTVRADLPAPADQNVWLNQISASEYNIYTKVLGGASPRWMRYHMYRQTGAALFEAGGAIVAPTPANETPNNWSSFSELATGASSISSDEAGIAVGLTMTGGKSFIGANHGYETLVGEAWTIDGSAASFSGGWANGASVMYAASTNLQHPDSGGSNIATRQWTLKTNKTDGYFHYNITYGFVADAWAYLFVNQLNHGELSFDSGRLLTFGPDYDITDATDDGGIRSRTWVLHDTTNDVFAVGYTPNAPNDFLLGGDYTYFNTDGKVRPRTIFSTNGIGFVNGDSITYDAYYQFFGGYVFTDLYPLAEATLQGAATLTADGTVTAATVVTGDATLQGAAATSITAVVDHNGIATIAGAALITATAANEKQSTSNLQGAASLTATATVDHNATATAQGAGALTADSAVDHIGAVVIQGAGNVIADGTTTATTIHAGSATLSGASLVNPVANVDHFGEINLTATATATVYAVTDHFGYVTAAGAALITADGFLESESLALRPTSVSFTANVDQGVIISADILVNPGYTANIRKQVAVTAQVEK